VKCLLVNARPDGSWQVGLPDGRVVELSADEVRRIYHEAWEQTMLDFERRVLEGGLFPEEPAAFMATPEQVRSLFGGAK